MPACGGDKARARDVCDTDERVTDRSVGATGAWEQQSVQVPWLWVRACGVAVILRTCVLVARMRDALT